MKKLFLLLVSSLMLQTGCIWAQGYNIKVNIPQLSNKKVILANYFEGKVYSVDTAQLDSGGNGAFRKTNKKLAKGMYLLLFSPSNYFDLIIGDNQNFSLQCDTLRILENLRFTGSPENTAFLEFQKFMTSQNQKTKKLSDALNKEPNKNSPEIKQKYTDLFNEADREVRTYIANIGKQYPGSALATFANFTLSPV
ncbi:MAG: DUF4369 domain-containing protein, partial [Odoribacter sp.]|nr:DUF4369 domain-containing protein [Odoribacter sp.]